MTPPDLSILHGPAFPEPEIKTLFQALTHSASTHPNAGITFVAQSGPSEHVSYSELRHRALVRLATLQQAGVTPGSTVLVLSGEPLEVVEQVWACLAGGISAAIVAAPLDWRNDSAGLRRLHDAVTVLSHPVVALSAHLDQHRELVAQATHGCVLVPLPPYSDQSPAAEPCDQEDTDALLLLTSGSTGLPKVVPVTHRQVLIRSASAEAALPIDAHDIALNWMPLDHVGGIVMMHLSPVVTGCPQVQIATSTVLAEPTRWLDLAHDFGCTYNWAPNFSFAMLNERLREPGAIRNWDLSRLRVIMNGGEAVNPDTAALFLRLLAPFGLPEGCLRPMWGMSETASGSVLAPRLRSDLLEGAASVGLPFAGLDLRLVDEDSQVVPRGTVGTLHVRGELVLSQYRRCDEEASKAFLDDGWFSTGDEGVVLDGELVLVGRTSETVIINGVNYHCPALEVTIEQLPWVRPGHAAVVGVRPEHADTDHVVAFVSLRDPARATGTEVHDLKAHLRSEHGLRCNEVVILAPEDFPRTGLGKIQRKLLAARYHQSVEAGASAVQDSVAAPILAPTWVAAELPPPIPAPPGLIAHRGDLARSCAQLLRSPHLREQAMATFVNAKQLDVRLQCVLLDGTDEDWAPEDLLRLGELAASSAGTTREPNHLTVGVIAPAGADPEQITGPTAQAVSYLQNCASEVTGLTVGVVYLGDNDPPALEALSRLIGTPQAQPLLLRGSTVFQQMLGRPKVTSAPPILRLGGRYLVTGLGEVASALASYLRLEYDAEVFIVTRSPDMRTHPEGSKLLGGDVTDLSQATRAIEDAGGGALDGIFHLAGNTKEWPLARMSADVLARTIAPKATGLDNLLHALDKLGIDVPIVAFSSILTSLFGPMYGPYVAANRHMEQRARQHYPKVRAIAWGAWDGLGISRDVPLGRRAFGLGFGSLALPEALRGLALAIACEEPVVLVGVNPKGSRVAPTLMKETDGETVSVLISRPSGVQPDTAPSHQAPTAALTPAEDAVFQPLVALWRELLDVPEVDLGSNFFDLGGDSLSIAELHSSLCQLVDAELPLGPLFRMANLGELVRFVADPSSWHEDDEPTAETGG